MLNAEMKTLISNHSAGLVATVNDDGTPSVSPKATFVVVDNTTIAFGNIRSPGTLANIRVRPAVEVSFIDVVLRKAVRISGSASFHRKTDASVELTHAFQSTWGAYLAHISGFVQIDVSAAQLILSPAYDLGHTEDELRQSNLQRLNAI